MPGEHAAGCRDDGQSEATEDARDLLLVAVDAATGTRDALDAVDDGFAVLRVFEVDPEHALDLVLHQLVVADEALALENARDLDLQLGSRQLDAIVARLNSVADPREHIRDGISHRHS